MEALTDAPDATPDAPSAGSPSGPSRPRPSRRTLWLILTPIVILSVAGTASDIFAAAIIKDHPLLQMFLNPRNRYLAYAAIHVDAVPYYTVGFFRLVLTDPLFYLLGVLYGDAALRWVERKMGDSEGFIKMIERGFAKAAYPVVMLMPNYLVCVMAGASGMRLPVFIALNVTGTIFRLVSLRYVGDAFSGPLTAFVDFISRYRWWFVAFSAAVFGLQYLTKRRAGKSEIESPATLVSELEAEVAAQDSRPGVDGPR